MNATPFGFARLENAAREHFAMRTDEDLRQVAKTLGTAGDDWHSRMLQDALAHELNQRFGMLYKVVEYHYGGTFFPVAVPLPDAITKLREVQQDPNIYRAELKGPFRFNRYSLNLAAID